MGSNEFKGSNFSYPARDELSAGFGVGGGSTPSAPSVYPNIDMTGHGDSDAAVGNKNCEEFVGMAPDGPTKFVQLVEGAPESYNAAGLGDTMVGGLGTPPRP